MTLFHIISLLFLMLINLLICGLIGQLIGSLISGLLAGLAGTEIERSTFPNQGIRQSISNGIILAVIGSVLLSSIFSLFGLPNLIGMGLGLLLGLFALEAALKHLVLRVVLFIGRWSPWNYADFLNYSVNSVLLQRIGGGYIFVHRSLLEHFASLPIGYSINHQHQSSEPTFKKGKRLISTVLISISLAIAWNGWQSWFGSNGTPTECTISTISETRKGVVRTATFTPNTDCEAMRKLVEEGKPLPTISQP
ncbi:hypothetical protein APA_1235 [Pseudanabaena sp. lw0831]|uniref:hypothetical protein n=1 Tax=Pseudanabaena sp. lw0831 TaxID=1357935 RepID=UPI0019166423|nr:hypothetical protein [Pseudanabaena sp. lw0831]GBO53328.1 hypothetical protein APA_1235 [Pseudanabaena sp. lw0831]